MVRGKTQREVKIRLRKVSGGLNASQMKGYQLLISLHSVHWVSKELDGSFTQQLRLRQDCGILR